MKRLMLTTSALIGLMALPITGSLALAAKPLAPVASETSEGSGKINFLDMGRGMIVISDREYRLTDKAAAQVRKGLRKGMHVKFSSTSAPAGPVIDEIGPSQ